jgi:hypothetical protein
MGRASGSAVLPGWLVVVSTALAAAALADVVAAGGEGGRGRLSAVTKAGAAPAAMKGVFKAGLDSGRHATPELPPPLLPLPGSSSDRDCSCWVAWALGRPVKVLGLMVQEVPACVLHRALGSRATGLHMGSWSSSWVGSGLGLAASAAAAAAAAAVKSKAAEACRSPNRASCMTQPIWALSADKDAAGEGAAGLASNRGDMGLAGAAGGRAAARCDGERVVALILRCSMAS